jgi:FkbM family methyltransferase
VGALLTPLLLARFVRRASWGRRLYSGAYQLGKAIADRGTGDFLVANLAPGMTVVDVGANIGYYTLIMASRVAPGGHVIAFEPDPFSAGILAERLARRRHPWAGTVALHGLALGRRRSSASLHCGHTNRADNRLTPGGSRGEVVPVEVVDFDGFARANGLPRVDAVKIDVQGAELMVLEGMRETLRHDAPRWLLLELAPGLLRQAGADPVALWTLAAEFGYEVSELAAGGRLRPVSDRDTLLAGLGETGYTDLWLSRAC